MFFGVFDFTFAVWIVVGAVSVLIVLGANEWFKDRGIPMNWWRWILVAVWYVLFMMGLAAPFTIMGEGEAAAGWRMLLFSLPVFIILGFCVYRLILIGREAPAEE